MFLRGRPVQPRFETITTRSRIMSFVEWFNQIIKESALEIKALIKIEDFSMLLSAIRHPTNGNSL